MRPSLRRGWHKSWTEACCNEVADRFLALQPVFVEGLLVSEPFL